MLQFGTTLVIALAFAAIAFAVGGYLGDSGTGDVSTKVLAVTSIAIWWVVGVGVLARWWRGRSAVPRDAVVAGAILAAFAILTALSMLWASDAGRAFIEVVRVSTYLGLFTLIVLAAGAVGSRAILSGLALGLLIVGAAALGSRLIPGVISTGDPDIFAALPSDAGRLSYPIGYWNGLGACMGALIVLLSWLGAVAGGVRARALAVALIPVPLLVIYLASSRGGYAAAAVGVLVLVLLGPHRRSRALGAALLGSAAGAVLAWVASRQADLVDGLNTDSAQDAGLLLAAAVVAAGAALAVIWPRLEPRLDTIRMRRPSPRATVAIAVVAVAAVAVVVNPIERVEEFTAVPSEGDPAESGAAGQLIRGSGSGRYQYWEAAVDAYASDPVTGIGAGNFELWWNANGTLERTINNAHSLYIETLSELGIAGLLLLLAFIAALGHAVYRGLRDSISPEACAAAGLVAAGLLSAALDWTWELTAVFGIVIVGAAVLTSDTGPRVRAVGENGLPEGAVPGAPRDGFALGVAAIAAAWVSIWAAGVLLLSEVKLDDSQAALARGDFDAAAQDAVDAEAVQPWSAEAPYLESQAELARGNLDQARVAAEVALDRAPGDYRFWYLLALIEIGAGDEDAYGLAFARANELAPEPIPPPEGAQG
jgi:hypothetical protein